VVDTGSARGLGEKRREVEEVLQDLSHAGCDMLTIYIVYDILTVSK
jgi:lipoate synthase